MAIAKSNKTSVSFDGLLIKLKRKWEETLSTISGELKLGQEMI